MKKLTAYDLATIALVATLYVVLTTLPVLSAISYGPIQFRISEMLNFLAFYNRKYIIAVTIGCMISNFMSFTIVDVIVGGLSTLVFLSLGIWLFDRFKNEYFFKGVLNKGFLFFSLFFSASMVTIAIELVIIERLPFFATWLSLAGGEFASLIIGSIIIDKLSKRVSFAR
ncbi:QueT transporter family protein [Lactococcus nasutitermitis]|uniref:QueT transporter family protein n=1 Tax=Lactococcus nasutitermitis TaxID=1652957 RepID=A0ABV9JEV8_9LACT|nr:QueT transporter family protein [Lactococcus nasutitermitis]